MAADQIATRLAERVLAESDSLITTLNVPSAKGSAVRHAEAHRHRGLGTAVMRESLAALRPRVLSRRWS